MSKKEEQESRYTPAPPDYGEEPPYIEEGIRNPAPQSGINQYKPLIITAIVALAVVFLMNSFIMPVVGKKAYIDDITRLENDLVSVRDNIKTQNNKIDNSIKDAQAAVETKKKEIDTQVKNATNTLEQKIATAMSNLGNYLTRNDLNTINNNINNLSNKVNNLDIPDTSGMQAKIITLESEIDTLRTTIRDLEYEIDNIETSSSSKKPDVDLVQYSTAFVKNTSADALGFGFCYEADYTLTIDNDSSSDIRIDEENLFIGFNIAAGSTINKVQLVTINKNIPWGQYAGNTPEFYNTRDIEIDSDDRESYRLRLSVFLLTDTGAPTATYGVDLDDWSDI